MADREILAFNLRTMAAWCKSGEDDDGSGTFIPAYPSGDVYDLLTSAALELDATAAPVVVGEVTDAMVERALDAMFGTTPDETPRYAAGIRKALESALAGD